MLQKRHPSHWSPVSPSQCWWSDLDQNCSFLGLEDLSTVAAYCDCEGSLQVWNAPALSLITDVVSFLAYPCLIFIICKRVAITELPYWGCWGDKTKKMIQNEEFNTVPGIWYMFNKKLIVPVVLIILPSFYLKETRRFFGQPQTQAYQTKAITLN